MGSFDCYCALCAGPLGKDCVRFGSKKVKWLAKRRKRVDLRRRKLAGEDVNESDSDSDEDVTDDEVTNGNIEASKMDASVGDGPRTEDVVVTTHDQDIAMAMEFGEENDSVDDNDERNSEGSIDEWDEKCSYDPIKLHRKDIMWLDHGHALGFNPSAPGLTKTFISGRGKYDDYGDFHAEEPGNDPNDPKEGGYQCYTTYGQPDDLPAFPFHESCFRILKRCLGLRVTDNIDTDILHEVMCLNVCEGARSLSLNYGQIEGTEQFWESLPGEEYTVSDPLPGRDMWQVASKLIPGKIFTEDLNSLNLEHRVRSDSLRTLSYDVLFGILEHLPFKDTQALIQSSWHVFTLSRNNSFWKQMLRYHVLPWFWEVDAILLDDTLPATFGYKDAVLWLDAVTRPRYGIGGPLMGIANRRRIWDVCQQLAPQYFERVQPKIQDTPDDVEAQDILARAESLQTVVVTYPIPKAAHTTFAQFVHSWSEINYRSSVLDTYWATTGVLIGISVTFSGCSARVFGTTEGKRGSPLHIPAGEWIREIVVSVEEVNMFSRKQDRSRFRTALDNVPEGVACIRGMSVTLSDKTSKEVRATVGQPKNKRPFVVVPGSHLIGLTGQIADSGEICRLGLLQASDPYNEPVEDRSYTEAQQVMWNHSGLTLYCPSGNYWGKIWQHPDLSIRCLSDQASLTGKLRSFKGDIASDMTPWHVCIWASNAAPYKTLKRISCFQPVAGKIRSGLGSWPIPHIVGLEVGYNSGRQHELGGAGGPVPVQSPDWQGMTNPRKDLVSWITSTTLKPFDEASMEHFHMDGPGGEIITEVHASVDMKAIKLYTNKGRSCYFGEINRGHWMQYRAGEGQIIVGLVCAFGRLGGWSAGAKMYSHWLLSGLGVLTMAR